MRLRVLINNYQGLIVLLPLFLLFCSRGSEEKEVIPPPTNPLIREFIGYGVVNASFVHVMSEPGQDGVSLGYLRKGSLVRIIERRTLSNRRNRSIWVLVDTYPGVQEEAIQGWLEESSISVFENEVQALTAMEAMLQ